MNDTRGKNVALITGASSGIGKEFAKLHAANGGDLVLVARSEDKLAELKQTLESQYGIQVMTVSKDLGQSEAAQAVFDEVKGAGVEVDILINNAGFGGRGKFHERDWADDLAMINLNVTALTALTRLFLPEFVRRGSGRVLNVSSTASLVPGPLQAVYYATKAYVTSFSNAIAEELKGTGVTVTNLMPGATESGFAEVADLGKTPLFSKTASAEAVARAGYEGMLAGKLDVIAGIGTFQRLQLAMAPMAPKQMLLKQVREMQEI